jgi:DNA-binding NarL/FixJ family response regulator
MTAVRVLICDDHPLFRDGIRGLLESISDTEVVGEAATGEEAVELAASLEPKVVLMDLKLPGLSGIEATRQIARTVPETNVLVLSMLEDDESVFAAMRAGARGYLLKGATQEATARAIRAVVDGEMIFGPGIAERMIRFLASPRRPESHVFPELTRRELEILALIARGHTNPEIADALYVSLKTIQNHVSTIFTKLRVVDRAQAALRARDAGLGK